MFSAYGKKERKTERQAREREREKERNPGRKREKTSPPTRSGCSSSSSGVATCTPVNEGRSYYRKRGLLVRHQNPLTMIYVFWQQSKELATRRRKAITRIVRERIMAFINRVTSYYPHAVEYMCMPRIS